MNVPLVQEIAYYLLSRASRDRVGLGTTKLVKLFYLIDHSFSCPLAIGARLQCRLALLPLGPSCEELVEAAQSADGIKAEPAFEFSEGKFYQGYRVTQWHADASRRWPAPVRGVVESVLPAMGRGDTALGPGPCLFRNAADAAGNAV